MCGVKFEISLKGSFKAQERTPGGEVGRERELCRDQSNQKLTRRDANELADVRFTGETSSTH